MLDQQLALLLHPVLITTITSVWSSLQCYYKSVC
jgi:hypothetical protein